MNKIVEIFGLEPKHHEEEVVEVGTKEKPETKIVWLMKTNLNNETVANLSSLLSQLGYFSTASTLKGIFK